MTEQPEHATALDSDEQQVGALYAQALLSAAGDSADDVVSEFEALVSECLDPNPNLEVALASPRIGLEQKEQMLDRIFNGKIQGTLLNFIKVLCRRDRIQYLRAIQVTTTLLREQALGKQRVIVTSAMPLEDAQRESIRSALRTAYGKEAVLVEKVDDSLLGGVVLRIGDEVIDGSVLGKMDAIRSTVATGVQKAIRDKYDSLLSS